MCDHVVPGEHEYEGIWHMGIVPETALDKVMQLDLRPDDIFIATYPKAGTTWMREIVSMVMAGGEKVTVPKNERAPFIEFHMGPKAVADLADARPSPRLYATHLMPEFFEKHLTTSRPRFIVLNRNPKDILVSYYHYYRASGVLGNFKGDFHEFFELHKANKLIYGNGVDYMKAWWKYQHEENILTLSFEDMKVDHEEAVQQIATFLKIELSNDAVQAIVEASTFDVMTNNPAVNMTDLPKHIFDPSISKYLRKGEVGDWVNLFSKEESEYIDKEVETKLKGTGLEFKYE